MRSFCKVYVKFIRLYTQLGIYATASLKITHDFFGIITDLLRKCEDRILLLLFIDKRRSLFLCHT